MGQIRVLLADDHGLLRKGVRSVVAQDPSIVVVGEASEGAEAVRLAEELSPDVVIIDIAMPGLNGLDAAALIARRERRVGVIVLTMYSDEEYLVRAVSAGVRGYLLKDSAEPDLIRAVNAVAAGNTFFSPAIADMLFEDYVLRLQRREVQDSYDVLTDREKQVLQLLAEGRTNKEVATSLSLGLSTVETHRMNLMKKLGLRNTAEIVLYAVRKKILRV
ncbi:MAG TPA: response regulator transcription factor [Vicinamibacterales bacterium]|jgi:DNA-binding NarL/FixJ family response regulator